MPFDESSPHRPYFRWEDERSPYIIELSVEMVDRLLPEIRAAQRAGAEIGGLLTGSLPKTKALTVRIEDYLLSGRPDANAGRYDLSPEQRATLSSTRHRLIEQQTPVLGFFRSHHRNEALLLSAEDSSFLNVEFRRAIHLALLISAETPHTAAFFVPGVSGVMQPGPPLSEFLFDAEQLAAVPQVTARAMAKDEEHAPANAERTPPPAHPPGLSPSMWKRPGFWGTAAGVTLICLLLTVWAPTTARIFASRRGLDLSVTEHSHVLELRWNQHQLDLLGASAATLTITDGAAQRQWTLSPVEMRSGSVAYEQHGSRVRFTLSLRRPDMMELVQSTGWPGPPTSPL